MQKKKKKEKEKKEEESLRGSHLPLKIFDNVKIFVINTKF